MKDKAFVGASMLAALAASMCCILPIVFVLLGAGVAGAAAFFATWRPLLLGITFVWLAFGFYFAYRKPAATCEPGSACEMPAARRTGRLWLWIATALVILFAAFPLYSGAVARLLLSNH
jgi:mercuric ion transport protein